MRDIKRSKVAKQYQFSKWIHTYGMLVLFVLMVVSPLSIPIMLSLNDLLCIPIIVIDALFIIVWCSTPEYENIEQCQKLMSKREYRKCERKNRKWLM